MPVEKSDTEVLGSGCVRQVTGGRGMYELMSPFVLEQDAKLFEWGAIYRGERNWEQGCPFSRCVQSIYRHLVKFMQRAPDEDHDNNMAAIRFWAGAIIHQEEMIHRKLMPEELDDLPKYDKEHYPPPVICKDAPKLERVTMNAVPPAGMLPTVETSERKRVRSGPETTDGIEILKRRYGDGKQKKIYVAGPITADTTAQRLEYNLNAIKVAEELERMGHLVFCPHRYEAGVLTDDKYEALMQFDFSIIRDWATALFLVAPSPGANREEELAKDLGIPVFCSTADWRLNVKVGA